MALRGGMRTIELGKIQGEGKGLDKEMMCVSTREPGPSHVIEVHLSRGAHLSLWAWSPCSRELGLGVAT